MGNKKERVYVWMIEYASDWRIVNGRTQYMCWEPIRFFEEADFSEATAAISKYNESRYRLKKYFRRD